MWIEYLKSLAPKASLIYSKEVKNPCADVERQVIKMPIGLPENILTIASMKHELAHLLYTEKTYDKGCEDNNLKDRNGLHDLSNAIEDIRVEQKLGSQYIGIHENFAELSKMIFDKVPYLPNTIEGFSMLVNCYLKSGHYPAIADIDDNLREFFEANRVEILTDYASCKSVDDVMVMANKLLDKFEKENGKIPESKSDKQRREGGKSGKGGEGKGEGKGEKKDGEKEGEGEGEGKKKDGEGEGEGEGKKKDGEGEGDSEKESEGSESSMQDMIRKLIAKRTVDSYKEYGNDGTDIIYEGDKLKDKFRHLSARTGESIDKAVLKLRQLLMNWFVSEERNRDIRLIQRGKISSRDLFRVLTEKKPRVFKKRILGKTNKVDLEILIDHSGSMHGSKINKALELGLVLNEALKNVKEINYELVGFTTDGFDSGKYHGHGLDNVYYVYKRFGQKPNKTIRDLLSKRLGEGLRVLCHNNDYEAVRFGRQRIERQPNTRKIMFVISDGYPEVGFVSSSTLAELTKNEIRSTRKKGIEVYGFGIHTDLRSIYEKGFIELNYGDDLHQVISTELIKLIKQGEKYNAEKK